MISKILFAKGADEFLAMLEGKISKAPFFNRELVSTVLRVCFCCLAFSNVVLAFSILWTTSFLKYLISISSSKSTEGTIKSSRLAQTRLEMGLKMGSNGNKSSDGN